MEELELLGHKLKPGQTLIVGNPDMIINPCKPVPTFAIIDEKGTAHKVKRLFILSFETRGLKDEDAKIREVLPIVAINSNDLRDKMKDINANYLYENDRQILPETMKLFIVPEKLLIEVAESYGYREKEKEAST